MGVGRACLGPEISACGYCTTLVASVGFFAWEIRNSLPRKQELWLRYLRFTFDQLGIIPRKAMLPYVIGTVVGLAGLWHLLKHLYPWIAHDVFLISYIAKLKIKMRKFEKTKPAFTVTDRLIQQAEIIPNKSLIVFEHKAWSYKEINQQANRVARVLHGDGVVGEETIGVMMTNRPAFISIWFGISKLGASPAFLNYNLRSQSLLHCITSSKCTKLIVSDDQSILNAIEEIETELKDLGMQIYIVEEPTTGQSEKYKSLLKIAENESGDETPIKWRDHVTLESHFCYMFTSGTTGLPKAAIISNARAWMAAHAFGLVGIAEEDLVYTALPLYHGSAGLLGLLGVINTGATMVLRRKFSASAFWDECREYGVTVVQYIGETLRYVCNQPAKSNDQTHSVRILFGNGLSPGVWDQFLDRFGKHICVAEFYTSTEGNIGVYNGTNLKHSVGLLSPVMSALAGVAIIKFDLTKDAPVLGENGFCVKAALGESGLLIGKISTETPFAGYRGNKKMTERKIMRNVFKTGDSYFSSGDIMLRKEDYSVSFVDRIGDTFRWKGENVSTCEVGDEMVKMAGISEANIYGVKIPGMEGRAGMMAAVLDSDVTTLDGQATYEHTCKCLPAYARPLFIRVQSRMELTGTLKQRKTTLVEEGFDIDKTGEDPMYMLSSKEASYVPFTAEMHASVKDGSLKL